MQAEYGRAVVRERTNPKQLAELARYLRMEYGPGTGPGYFFAELADGARTRKAEGTNGVLSALRRVVRALTGNGGTPETSSG